MNHKSDLYARTIWLAEIECKEDSPCDSRPYLMAIKLGFDYEGSDITACFRAIMAMTKCQISHLPQCNGRQMYRGYKPILVFLYLVKHTFRLSGHCYPLKLLLWLYTYITKNWPVRPRTVFPPWFGRLNSQIENESLRSWICTLESTVVSGGARECKRHFSLVSELLQRQTRPQMDFASCDS